MKHLKEAMKLIGQEQTKLRMEVVGRDEAWLIPTDAYWDFRGAEFKLEPVFMNDRETIKEALAHYGSDDYWLLENIEKAGELYKLVKKEDIPGPEDIDFAGFEHEGKVWYVYPTEMFTYFDTEEEWEEFYEENYGVEEEW